MNNTFNINRFLLLVQRQWLSFRKEYFLIVGVVLAIVIFFYSKQVYDISKFASLPNAGDQHFNLVGTRTSLFCILGVLYVTLIASAYFRGLGKSGSAIPNLLLPASQFEKFLNALVYTVLLGFTTFLLLFYIVDYGFMSYLRGILTSQYSTWYNGEEIVTDRLAYLVPSLYNENIVYAFFVPFLLNAIFLLGSIYFAKSQYVKTIVSVSIYIAICYLIIYVVYRIFFADVIQLEDKNVKEFINPVKLLSAIGWFITVALWTITYFRLKEKEV